MSLRRGSYVTITCGDQRLTGMVILCSPNQLSLMVSFDGALRVGGGLCIGFAALLGDDGDPAAYHELITNTPVTITEEES